MPKRLKTIKAGPLIRYAASTMALPQDTAQARAAKSKLSSACRQALNIKFSRQKLRFLLAANFGSGDLSVTLTYRDEVLPANRKAALQDLRAYFNTVRAQRRRTGHGLRYIYVIERNHGDGRFHHHIILNSTTPENDLETLCSLWTRGNVEVRPIQADGFLELADYLTKEPKDGHARKVGERNWSCSKGLVKPESESRIVPDNFTLTAPPESVILEADSKLNTYGSFEYLEYLEPQRPA